MKRLSVHSQTCRWSQNGWALCIIVLWQFHELIAQFMTLIFHFAKLRSRSVQQHSFPFVNLAKKSLQIIVIWSNFKPLNSFKKWQDVWCEFNVLSDILETYHVRGLKIQPILNLTRICRHLIKCRLGNKSCSPQLYIKYWVDRVKDNLVHFVHGFV